MSKGRRTKTPPAGPGPGGLAAQGEADARAGRYRPPAAGGARRGLYDQGYKRVAPIPTADDTPAADPPAAAGGGRSSSSTRRTTSGRRRRSGRAGAPRRISRKAAREITAPIESSVQTGANLIGVAVLIAVLYNLLTNAGAASTAIDRMTRSLRWLFNTDPIPYRTN